jgi:hypothetical protein
VRVKTQKQIPSLRCGMTNKKAKGKTKADSLAALRNDKQKGKRQSKSGFLRCAAE